MRRDRHRFPILLTGARGIRVNFLSVIGRLNKANQNKTITLTVLNYP